MDIKPNFFILGAPKCGTSAVCQYLSGHPQVFMSTPKEPGYMDRDLRYAKPSHCSYHSLHDYLSLFDSADPLRHKVIGESSVFMLYSKSALDQILSINKFSKFLVILRNPYESSISMHRQNLKCFGEDREPMTSFEDAWDDLSRRARISTLGNTNYFKFKYDSLFSYSQYIERLTSRVPHSQIVFIKYEDFCRNNQKEMQKIYSFLDIDPKYHSPKLLSNIGTIARDNLLSRFVFKIANLSKRLRFLRFLKGRRYTLLFTQKKPNEIHISPKLKSKMVLTFRSDIEKVQNLTGLDLRSWT